MGSTLRVATAAAALAVSAVVVAVATAVSLRPRSFVAPRGGVAL